MTDNECYDDGNQSYSYSSSYSSYSNEIGAGDKAVQAIIIITLCAVCFVGVIGNSLVLLSLFIGTRKLGITSILLGSLAFSDFCITAWYVPMEVKFLISPVWNLGSFMCYFTGFLGAFAQSSSAFMLLVISCERFLVILYPLASRTMLTRRRTSILIVMTWVVAAALAAFPASYKKVYERPCYDDKLCTSNYSDFEKKFFYFYALFILYLLPLGGIIIANTCVIRALIISSRYTQKLQSVKCIEKAVKYSTASKNGGVSISEKPIYRNNNSSGDIVADNKSSVVASGSGEDPFPPVPKTKVKPKATKTHSSVTQRKRVMVMLLSVVLLYAICWLPYFIYGMLYIFVGISPTNFGMIIFETFSRILYSCSSALNPIVYGFMSKNFRQRIIHGLTRCISCKGRRRGRANSFGSAYTLSTKGSGNSHNNRHTKYSVLPKA